MFVYQVLRLLHYPILTISLFFRQYSRSKPNSVVPSSHGAVPPRLYRRQKRQWRAYPVIVGPVCQGPVGVWYQGGGQADVLEDRCRAE